MVQKQHRSGPREKEGAWLDVMPVRGSAEGTGTGQEQQAREATASWGKERDRPDKASDHH